MVNPKLLAAAFVQRQRYPVTKRAVYSCDIAKAMASSSTATADEADDKRFFAMEKRNWEQGFEAYDEGFGPLTRQTIPALLSDVRISSSNFIDDDCHHYKLLDVATGPGFVLSAAIDAAMTLDVPKESYCNFQFTGLDITENFLQMAKQRIDTQLQNEDIMQNKQKQFNVDFVKGSAESLPFDDESFDKIVCNFGILHFFHPHTFLRESYRVLRPGGSVSFSAWAPPDRTEGFRIALESIAEVGNPNVEGIPDGPNFFDFGDSKQATNVLNEIGFVDTKSVELSEMKWTSVRNGSDLYNVLLQGTSRTREILLGQTEEETAAIRSLMSEKYDEITTSNERCLAMPAVVTSGCKPVST